MTFQRNIVRFFKICCVLHPVSSKHKYLWWIVFQSAKHGEHKQTRLPLSILSTRTNPIFHTYNVFFLYFFYILSLYYILYCIIISDNRFIWRVVQNCISLIAFCPLTEILTPQFGCLIFLPITLVWPPLQIQAQGWIIPLSLGRIWHSIPSHSSYPQSFSPIL